MQDRNPVPPILDSANQLPALPPGPSLDKLRGPVELGTGPEIWQIALAVLLLGLMAGFLMWFLLRSRRSTAPPPAEELALAELEAATLAEEDIRFAQLCANSLRNYLGAQHHLPADTLTSAELYQRLPIRKGLRDEVRQFLDWCDSVKFAGRELRAEAREQMLRTARGIIESGNRKVPPPL